MSTTALSQEYRSSAAPPPMIERFLRDRQGLWQQISQEYDLGRLIWQMFLYAAAGLACYGAVMGSASGNPLQVLASALKLPLLFLLTLMVCMPTFYLYNLLFGGHVSARQTLALMLSAITITSIFTLAFAPITLFFLVTVTSFNLFILINMLVLSMSSSVGLLFLIYAVRRFNELAPTDGATLEARESDLHGAAPPPRINPAMVYVWFVIALLIGAQLIWTLQPFFGSTGGGFELFLRPENSNFFRGLRSTLTQLLAG